MILYIKQIHILCRLIFFSEIEINYYIDCINFEYNALKKDVKVFILSLTQYAIKYEFLTPKTWGKQFVINSKLKLSTLLKLSRKLLENLKLKLFAT